MNMIEAWFDGVCQPVNPGGHAAYGALVKVDGRVVMGEGKYVGEGVRMSNNVAEYSGCIAVLEKIITIPGVAIVRGDSKLVIGQLYGVGYPIKKWKIHGGLYVPFYNRAKELMEQLKGRVTLQWVPRDQNGECDEYSKQVLRDRGIKFKIQPEK